MPVPRKVKRVLWLWAPPAACAAAILWGSLRPKPAVPPPVIPHLDKLIHAVAYGLLALLLARALRQSWRAALAELAFVAAVWAVAYGTAVELLQMTRPERTPSMGDILANAVGAALAVLLWARIVGRVKRGPVPAGPDEGSEAETPCTENEP
jgi:VanZ family protein